MSAILAALTSEQAIALLIALIKEFPQIEHALVELFAGHRGETSAELHARVRAEVAGSRNEPAEALARLRAR